MFIKEKSIHKSKENVPATKTENTLPEVIPVKTNNALSKLILISVESPPIIENLANRIAFGNVPLSAIAVSSPKNVIAGKPNTIKSHKTGCGAYPIKTIEI